MFPPLASRAQGISGCSPASQAPVQPAQERWPGCWSCSLGPRACDRLPPVPHSRSPLRPLFHQFSPLEIRCVWLVADGVHLVSAAADLCHKHSALMSRWWWRGGCVSTEWAFLKKKKATHSWNSHFFFFFRWKFKSSEVGKCQIFVCLASPNLASCLCVLLRSSVAFVMGSFFPWALIHVKFGLVSKSTLWN